MSSKIKGISKAEAAEISKKAILDAAEILFAQKGYDATSLQEICNLAKVTRGLPNYFFGSKEELYRKVLERAFALPQELITFIQDQLKRPDTDNKVILHEVISRLYDDLNEHPNFVRISEWEALHGGHFLGNLPFVLEFLREGALKVLQVDLGWPDDTAEQFLLDLVALCWFPIIHQQTFLKPLGLNFDDPLFQVRRKQHVLETLLRTASDVKKKV